jgi:hypothetical protein
LGGGIPIKGEYRWEKKNQEVRTVFYHLAICFSLGSKGQVQAKSLFNSPLFLIVGSDCIGHVIDGMCLKVRAARNLIAP